MNTDKIKQLIENSDYNNAQKSILTSIIDRAIDENAERRALIGLIEQVSGENVSEVILSNDEVKIYTVSGKKDWDIKYPYRSIFVNEKGVWQRSNTVSPSLDVAYLIYLQNKYIGLNSQFADFAMKMLGIQLED